MEHRSAQGHIVRDVRLVRPPSTLQTTNLKKITGEDYIDAEEKNKQKRLTFMNIAKEFILGNRYPKVNDATLAFWERAIILNFPSNFVGKNNIPTIWNTWINDPDEMSGIFNWMLEGLKRLLKNNGFTKTKTSEETKIEFQRLSDTTEAFLNELCEHVKESVYIKTELYEKYKEYCDAEGLDCDPYSKFSAKINSQPWIKTKRLRVNGKKEHVWLGLRVKPMEEEDENQQKLDTAGPPGPPGPPIIPRQNLGENNYLGGDREREDSGRGDEKGGPPGPVESNFPDGCARRCVHCGQPIEGALHAHIGAKFDEPAHLDCEKKWRQLKGYDVGAQ